jgi:hypothetical protein
MQKLRHHHILDRARNFLTCWTVQNAHATIAGLKPAAQPHYGRWAEAWTKARGHQSPERTREWFEALGRSTSIANWQFRQAVDAARIPTVAGAIPARFLPLRRQERPLRRRGSHA